MTDKQIYKLCCEYGSMSLTGRHKFVALLPEVFKRRIYRKYKYCSIYEFGAKLCGLSNNIVDEALRLGEKFKNMPELLDLMSKVGLSKLRIIACIADESTASIWAKRVQKMSRKALETLVKDIRREQEDKIINSQKYPGIFPEERSTLEITQPQAQRLDSESAREFSETQNVSTRRERFSMDLNQETINQLKLIKQKFEKQTGEKLCWNEVVQMAAAKLLAEAPVRDYKQRPHKSRPIPAIKRREMPKMCTVPGCNEPAEEIHHKKSWAIFRDHKDLEAFCKAHHELAHQSDSTIDKKFRHYKMQYATLRL